MKDFFRRNPDEYNQLELVDPQEQIADNGTNEITQGHNQSDGQQEEVGDNNENTPNGCWEVMNSKVQKVRIGLK